MNTLEKNKIQSEVLTNLRITNVFFDKKLDIMIVLLNNREILQFNISDFPCLQKATIKELNNWRLIGGGVGIHWIDLDEDLSLQGFLKQSIA